MFHQVMVDPKDVDALRFLWWPDDDLSKLPVEYRMKVHHMVLASPSLPANLDGTLKKCW